jgi:hypothetical protein
MADPRAADRMIAEMLEPFRSKGGEFASLPPVDEYSGQAHAKRRDVMDGLFRLAALGHLRDVLHYAKRRESVLGSGVELGREDGLDGLRLTPDDMDAEDLPHGRPPTVSSLRPADEVDLGGLEQIARACRDAGMVADGEVLA